MDCLALWFISTFFPLAERPDHQLTQKISWKSRMNSEPKWPGVCPFACHFERRNEAIAWTLGESSRHNWSTLISLIMHLLAMRLPHLRSRTVRIIKSLRGANNAVNEWKTQDTSSTRPTSIKEAVYYINQSVWFVSIERLLSPPGRRRWILRFARIFRRDGSCSSRSLKR